jgi:hypothetical protein
MQRITHGEDLGAFVALAYVLEHLPAGLFTAAALFRTGLHMLIFREALARLVASCTRVGTGMADKIGERPMAGNDAGGGAAHITAVPTGLQRVEMVGLAICQQMSAVSRTRFARPAASRTRGGTFLEHSAVLLARPVSLSRILSEDAQLEDDGDPDCCKS